MTMQINRGFTIVELMITIGLLAILAAYAIPNFDRMIRQSAVKKTQEDLYAGLILARSESIARARSVTICPVADPFAAKLECSTTSGDWNSGWIIFSDTNADAVIDDADVNVPADELIRFYSNRNQGMMSMAVTGSSNHIIYNSRGLLGAGNRTFTFCDDSVGFSHALIVGTGTGRVRYSAKKPDGSDLTCG